MELGDFSSVHVFRFNKFNKFFSIYRAINKKIWPHFKKKKTI